MSFLALKSSAVALLRTLLASFSSNVGGGRLPPVPPAPPSPGPCSAPIFAFALALIEVFGWVSMEALLPGAGVPALSAPTASDAEAAVSANRAEVGALACGGADIGTDAAPLPFLEVFSEDMEYMEPLPVQTLSRTRAKTAVPRMASYLIHGRPL